MLTFFLLSFLAACIFGEHADERYQMLSCSDMMTEELPEVLDFGRSTWLQAPKSGAGLWLLVHNWFAMCETWPKLRWLKLQA